MGTSSNRIPIKFFIQGLGEVEGELVRFRAPRTVDALVRKMPIEGRAALLKGGLYFTVPLQMGLEKPVKTVSSGTIAFWPLGSALCLFYDDSTTYSPVNVVGNITFNDVLQEVQMGTILRVEKM
ncbi:MAG: cyclophilin-like family protein [Candidatus Bathyarchaeia archaeon]